MATFHRHDESSILHDAMILCLASLLSPPEEHSTVVKANVSLNLEMPNVLQRFLFCIVNVWLYVCILIEK